MSAVSDPSQQAGSRFNLVNALPATTFVLFVSACVTAGGFAGEPSVRRLSIWVNGLGIREGVVLGFAIFAIGLVLNSFQTKSVKLIEGYWRPVGLRLLILENGIQRHSDERSHIGQMQTAKWEPPRWHQFCRNRLSTDRQDFQKASRRRWLRQAARFPQLKKNAEDRIMPKRLGNALRRAEDLAGDRYGIPAVTAVPYLLDVASESMRSIVDDSQTEIDVTTKFVWVWAACSAVAIAAFINDGHDVHG